MLDWAIAYREHPVAIRVPVNGVVSRRVQCSGIDWAKPAYEVAHRGNKVALFGLGAYFQLAENLRNALTKEGIDATLINPRIITALDTETLDSLKADHSLVVTLEDGQIDGGWGEKIARYYGDSPMRVLVRGERKQFEDRYQVDELLKANRLTVAQLVEDVKNLL